MLIFQYDAKVPASAQWQAGIQKTLPWASVVDVSYVGNHGYNRLGGFQNGNTVNLNAIDFGAAYLPQNQDPTKGAQTVPGAECTVREPAARRTAGSATSTRTRRSSSDTYHSIQANFNRRFRNGFSFGVNYTLSLSFTGNTGLTQRLQHERRRHRLGPRGSGGVRGSSTTAEPPAAPRQGQLGVGSAEDSRPSNSAGEGHRRGHQRLAGLGPVHRRLRQPLRPGLQLPERHRRTENLTGSPDYGARIVYNGDTGKGCSSNQFTQFNTAGVPGPTYNSVGLESGRNVHDRLPRSHDRPRHRAQHPRSAAAVSSSCDSTRINVFNVGDHHRSEHHRGLQTARPTRR